MGSNGAEMLVEKSGLAGAYGERKAKCGAGRKRSGVRGFT
jgi:hypothetical protein